MKIIYFTTAVEKNDFLTLSKMWTCSLNTSIQNFHNRLIRSLALTHEVDVISFRPFSRKKCIVKKLDAENKLEGNINWNYVAIKSFKPLRIFFSSFQASRLMKSMNLKDAVILTETLNPYIITCASKLAVKHQVPIIGICHTSPSGIHDTGPSYTRNILSKTQNLTGYIALTNELNELFNKNHHPSLTFSGIIENKYRERDYQQYGRYCYYDGNLQDNFGVYDLIDAFISLNLKDIKLLISGYHADEEKIKEAIKNYPNIIYLGMQHIDTVITLINHAFINVNARPFSEDYDRYFMNDHFIDYLDADNGLTLSAKTYRLDGDFSKSVVWMNDGEKEDIIEGINKCLAMDKNTRETMIKRAKVEANRYFSMSSINKKTIAFLKYFLRQKD